MSVTLQVVEAGIGNTSGAAPTAKILRLPDRAARGAPDGEDRAPEGLTLVRAVYEAAGGSCAEPVEMRPLARRLGLAPRAVENLAMRLQAERLVRVVSMANGLLRLTPEGARVAERLAEGAASDSPGGGARGDPPGPAAPTGAPPAGGGGFAGRRAVPTSPVVGRGALRELWGMIGPLKADLDRLDLDGALGGEQRSELAAEIRTIEAQLGSPRPKRRIVAAALESVGDVVGSAAGAAGGAGSETGSERILLAIDEFLDGNGGVGQTGRAARGARNGAGLARPRSDLADDENGSVARHPEEGEERSAADVRPPEASGVRVRKRARDDGGRAPEQARGAGRQAGEGVNGAVGEAGEGAGSAVEDVGAGEDQAVQGAGGAAGRAGDAADRARAREAEAGRRVLRVVDPSGDVIRTILNGDGEILEEAVVGQVADPPAEERPDDGGRVAGRAKDGAGRREDGEADESRATGEVDRDAERATGEVGQGADRAARGAGAAAGRAVEGAGEAAGQAAEGAKRTTQDRGGAVGQVAKRGGGDGAREADDAVDQTAGRVDGAVRRATGLAGEARKGVRGAAGRAVDQAAGTAEGIAPRPQMPGGRTLGEERQTVRRAADEPGCITIQSTLDGSGNVLDEKIVGRQ